MDTALSFRPHININAALDARCAPTPAPGAAEDAEVVAALESFSRTKGALAKKAIQSPGSMGLEEEGTADEPAASEAYNPFGFCPLETRAQRLQAAKDVGGNVGLMDMRFKEFNAGLMALGGTKPFNPATDPKLEKEGPIEIDSKLFNSLNKALPTWKGLRQAGFLAMALPAFILTDGGNRTSFFMNKALESCWTQSPLAMGPQVFRHEVVEAALNDPKQKRGYYTGTAAQHPDFFHPETALFLDGDRHRKLRELLELAGFARRYAVDVELARQIPKAEGCTVPEKAVFSKHVGVLVQKAIWGREPPSEIVTELETYGAYGAYGIFGDVIQPVLDKAGIAGKVKTARETVGAWAQGTPFAEVFLKARDHSLPGNPWFLASDTLLDGVGVASLFAGLVGTMDATTKCVSFQKEDARHQELFKEHPEKYLIELMRFDSAVTSVTEVLQEDTNMILQGRNITLKAGTPQQLVIATANRDPTFWETPDKFSPDRSQLKETLSWNGRAVDVEARSLEKAPRHCPGMCLSLKVAAAVCASMMGVFEELFDQGKILANGGAVKCNNFGEHEEPELWAPPPTPAVDFKPSTGPEDGGADEGGVQPTLVKEGLLVTVFSVLLFHDVLVFS